MRGWALLDDYPVGFSPDQTVLWLNQSIERSPVNGDLIGFSATAHGPLRPGLARVREVKPSGEGWKLRFDRAICLDVPTVTGSDSIFVATAIGESAFDPAPSATIQ